MMTNNSSSRGFIEEETDNRNAMTYYNVGKIVNTQGLQGNFVFVCNDFADERFKKKSVLALLMTKIITSWMSRLRVTVNKNFDIVKFKGLPYQ
ncbi:MAG: hypothetical protein ACLS3V_00465 [Streptococcus sp.]